MTTQADARRIRRLEHDLERALAEVRFLQRRLEDSHNWADTLAAILDRHGINCLGPFPETPGEETRCPTDSN